MGRLMMLLVLIVLRVFAVLRPRLDISPGGVPYLIRWYLTPAGKGRFAKWYRQRLPGVFLHCFLASDPDRGWHSHPWHWATSLILKGAYLESRPITEGRPSYLYRKWYVFNEGDVNRLTGDDWHSVKLITPTVWTLFVVGPLHGREWGFMSEEGAITPHGTDTPGD